MGGHVPCTVGLSFSSCWEAFQVSCCDCIFLPVLNPGNSGEPFRTLTLCPLHCVSGANLTVGKSFFLSLV